MKKNIYRPALMSLSIAALLISALAATSYPARAALPARGGRQQMPQTMTGRRNSAR